jgi:hypothetical protein
MVLKFQHRPGNEDKGKGIAGLEHEKIKYKDN